MSQDTLININNVKKTYADGLEALKGVNLEIKRGEILALLGPNGAGKTTLINAICGIVIPTSGHITVDGFDVVKNFRETRSQIGLVPQELNLEAFEKVFQNVSFTRGLYGKKENPQYIEKILKDFSLWDKKDNRLRELSGGMKQRVGIARALAVNPSVLLMDEPLSALDSQTSEILLSDLIELWAKQHFTSVYITHNLSEAIRIGHKIIVMSRRPGEIRESVNIETDIMDRKIKNIELEEHLWKLLREEAIAAERELENE